MRHFVKKYIEMYHQGSDLITSTNKILLYRLIWFDTLSFFCCSNLFCYCFISGYFFMKTRRLLYYLLWTNKKVKNTMNYNSSILKAFFLYNKKKLQVSTYFVTYLEKCLRNNEWISIYIIKKNYVRKDWKNILFNWISNIGNLYWISSV